MATREDATLSVYLKLNQFIQYLTSVNDLPPFTLVATTSIEAAGTLLMDGTNKLILVQTKLKEDHFLSLEYKIFVSFADDLDTNAILTTEVISQLSDYLPNYSILEIFEASGLKLSTSVFNTTGCKLVVQSVSQETTSIPQMRNNLTAATIKLTGYIN